MKTPTLYPQPSHRTARLPWPGVGPAAIPAGGAMATAVHGLRALVGS